MAQPLTAPFQEILRKQQDAARNDINSAQLLHTFSSVTTVGWGEFTFDDQIDFETSYLDRPSVSYGCSLAESSMAQLQPTRYPMTSGQVYRWNVDRRGFYTGAWVVVKVQDQSPFMTPMAANPNYTLTHDFTFLGAALKDLAYYTPVDLGDVGE